MAEQDKKVVEQRVANAAVNSLTDVQVLQLYHSLQRDKVQEKLATADSSEQAAANAIIARAERLLDADVQIAGNKSTGDGVYAADFYDKLESAYGTAEYKQTAAAAVAAYNEAVNDKDVRRVANFTQADYAATIEDYNKAAAVLAERTGAEFITLDEASDSDKYEQAAAKLDAAKRKIYADANATNTIDASTKDALEWMSSTLKDIGIRSSIGDDDYRGRGSHDDVEDDEFGINGVDGTQNGPSDEGLGGDIMGYGPGKGGTGGGTGRGNGTGSGDGDGDGDGDGTGYGKSTSIGGKSSIEESHTPPNNTASMAADATAYIQQISNEPAINNIFFNSHYSQAAVPKWSFAVDFIPCEKADEAYSKYVNVEDMKILTQAVQSIAANAKTVNMQKLMYAGMQHPFFTKMPQTHGDIAVRFAENEEFTITKILTKLLKFGSFSTSFPTGEIPANLSEAAMEDAMLFDNNVEAMVAPDDKHSVLYKLNAVDFPMNDDGSANGDFSQLAHVKRYLFDIVLKLYRPVNVHIFGDESVRPPEFIYHYRNCWLKNIDSLDLNYDDDSVIDRTATFSYQYLITCTYAEYQMKYGALNDFDWEKSPSKDGSAWNDPLASKDAQTPPQGEVNLDSRNLSPANMTPQAAKEFRETYKDTAGGNAAAYSNYMQQQAEAARYRR